MRDILLEILAESASPRAVSWLRETVGAQREAFQRRPFYYAFSGVSRHFDRRGLVRADEDRLAALQRERLGFTVVGWDEFRLARVILLLVLGEQEKSVFLENLRALIDTADLREQAAIYSAFPLLPHPEDLVEFATDGLRTNIVDVFDSIALNNPFPAEQFSDEAWNQMVLKALFIDRPLYRIHGLEERANATLAEALSNLAHERWAAGRWVSPELWRSCANFLTDRIVEDLERVAGSDDAEQREAVALLAASDDAGRLDHLHERIVPQLETVKNDEVSWDDLGRRIDDRR